MRTLVSGVAVGIGLLALVGCQGSAAERVADTGQVLNDQAGASPALAESLFKSDQAVLSKQEIERILSSRVYAPAHARVAVVRIGGRYP